MSGVSLCRALALAACVAGREPLRRCDCRGLRAADRRSDRSQGCGQGGQAGGGANQANGLLRAPVGILDDPVSRNLHVAHGEVQQELATARLLAQRLQRALTYCGQLKRRQGPLHAQKETVVGQTRVVDALLVGEQAPYQSTELEQRVPVAAVAGEA